MIHTNHTILPVSRQLSCHGMCEIMTWLDHYIFEELNIFFYKIWWWTFVKYALGPSWSSLPQPTLRTLRTSYCCMSFQQARGLDVPNAGTWIHSQLNGRMVGVISMQLGHTNTLQSISSGHLSSQWWHCTLGKLVLPYKNVKKPFCWSHQHWHAITVTSHEHHGPLQSLKACLYLE